VLRIHIDFDSRSKLDVKSRKCFFIGYGDEAFGYRFWDDQNWKIISSQNVFLMNVLLQRWVKCKT
jgi:hypothetical protein